MKSVLRFVCIILLCFVLAFTIKLRIEQPILIPSPEPEAIQTAEPVSPTVVPVATATATPEPTPEPTPEVYTISAVGDCTLWSNANYAQHPAGFAGTINGDYSYPFANTVEYFNNDELTLANLECILSDKNIPYDYTKATFAFIAPTEYANIMLEGGVDFVTTANNHLMDCYEKGRDVTYETLESYGLPYGGEAEAQIIDSKNGIKVGIYTSGIDMRPDWKTDTALSAIADMRAQGAELVICMFHWSDELYYIPYDYQTKLAHDCIDAGANIIYGSHPHCLQPIEEYNGGIILYSLGNWSFGGSTMPSDPDTAIVQMTVKRGADGLLHYDSFEAIPCCVSSKLEAASKKEQNYNDYKPTPYEADSEAYARTMSKLDGSFKPDSQGADYSAWWASRAG